MSDAAPPPKVQPPRPSSRRRPEEKLPQPPTAMQRLHPWVDLLAKLLTAIAAALAIWRAFG